MTAHLHIDTLDTSLRSKRGRKAAAISDALRTALILHLTSGPDHTLTLTPGEPLRRLRSLHDDEHRRCDCSVRDDVDETVRVLNVAELRDN